MSLSKPAELVDIQDSMSWNFKVVHEDLLCGTNVKISEGLVKTVLNEVAIVMFGHANVFGLLEYMMKRNLLTETEVWKLRRQDAPKEKALELHQILMRKGVDGFFAFYVCLIESYMMQDGLESHYALIKIIEKKVRTYCGIKPEILVLDAARLGPKIRKVFISPRQAQRLLQKLNIAFAIPPNNPTSLDIYSCWVSAKPNGDWTKLVEAFLTEPGMGYSVCGVQPIGSSNPPVVCSYVRSLMSEWVFFAQHVGFPLALIKKIERTHCYNIPAQIQAFLRECLIPDCGDERTKVIMSRVQHVVKLPKVKQQARDGVSAPLESVAEKEYYSAKVFEKSPSVCTQLQQSARSYGKWSNEEVNGPPQVHEERCAHRETVHSVSRKPCYVNPRDMPEPLPVPVQCSTTEPLPSMNNGQELLDSSIKGIADLATGLILSGSNLEAQTKNGRTPLHLWCEKNNEKMVSLLIGRGANIATKDNDGNTCLHLKEALKNSNLVRVLVDAFWKSEISVGQPNKNGVTPLVLCCQGGDICYESALLLITHGADIDCSPTCRPLLDAAAGGNERMVDLLLTYGANINQQDKAGSTALIQACLCNHTAIANVLLARGADVNKADKSGTTALAAAVTKNSLGMVRILIDTGAHINVSRYVSTDFTQGEVEETPLASACGHGLEEIADLLVRNGAKVNYMCSGQVPPIGFAIICRQYRMVKFMLELGEFNKSIYGLLVPMNIAMNAQNYQAASMILDVLGGPQKAMQIAEQNHLSKFVEEIQIFIAIAGDTSFPVDLEPTHGIGDRVKIEETLQRFSQIAMSAVTTNRDCESLVSIATALEAPHVAVFFREYYKKPPRPDKLKSTFLSRDHGVSPFNFLVQYQLLDSVQFQSHALEFYPEGPDQFYSDLVWAFHEIPGGETLSWDVHDVLQRLFGPGFQLNVQTGTAYQQLELARPRNRQEKQACTPPLGRALPLPPQWEGQKTDVPASENARPSGISHLLFDAKMPLDSITGGWRAALPGNSTVNLQHLAPPPHGRKADDRHVPIAPNMYHRPQREHNQASPTNGIVNLQYLGLPSAGKQANVAHEPTASKVHHQLQKQYDQGTTLTPVEPVSGPHLIYRSIDQANSTDSADNVKPPIMRKDPPPNDSRNSPVTPVSRTFSEHQSVVPTVQRSQNASANTESDQTSTHRVHRNSYNEVEQSSISDSGGSLSQTRELERNTSSKPVATIHPEVHSRDLSNSVPHEIMMQNRFATSRQATSDTQPSQLHERSLPLPRPRPSKIPVRCKSKHPRQHKDRPIPRVDSKVHVPPTTAMSPIQHNPQYAPASKSEATLLKRNPELKTMMKRTKSTNKFLGSGAYGSVDEVVSADGTIYAAKKFWVDQRQDKFWETFGKEVSVLSSLNHPNIVQYCGISSERDTGTLLLLMERLVNSLSECLCSSHLAPSTKVCILTDVAEGLTYLHSQRPAVIHRDLTAKNVLLDSTMRAKIADFGNARIADIESGEQKSMTGMPGTQAYMPPEACEMQCKYSKGLDIFSYGHLALFTAIQIAPHDLLPTTYKVRGKLTARTELERRQKYIDELHKVFSNTHPLTILIKKCLQNEPEMRPSAYTLVSGLQVIEV